jgi:hypothetical protein
MDFVSSKGEDDGVKEMGEMGGGSERREEGKIVRRRVAHRGRGKGEREEGGVEEGEKGMGIEPKQVGAHKLPKNLFP